MYPIDNFSHGSFWHCIKSNRILNSIIVLTIFFKFQFRNIQRANRFIPNNISNIYRIEKERDNYAIYTLYLLYIFTYHLQLLNFNYAEPSSKKEKTVGFRNYYHTKLRNKMLRKTISKILWKPDMEWGQSVDRAKENEIYIYDMMIIQLLIPNRASYHTPHWISRPQLLLRANMANRAKCLYIITNYNIRYYSVCSFISFFVTVTNCIFIIFLLSLNTDWNIFVTNCCNVFELIRKSNK